MGRAGKDVGWIPTAVVVRCDSARTGLRRIDDEAASGKRRRKTE